MVHLSIRAHPRPWGQQRMPPVPKHMDVREREREISLCTKIADVHSWYMYIYIYICVYRYIHVFFTTGIRHGFWNILCISGVELGGAGADPEAPMCLHFYLTVLGVFGSWGIGGGGRIRGYRF